MAFAIAAGPALLLVLIVIQVCVVYFANSIALGAATQGVNVERGYRATSGSGAAHAEEFLGLLPGVLTDPHVNLERSGTDVRITVTGNALSLVPGKTFLIRRSAHGSIERVTQP